MLFSDATFKCTSSALQVCGLTIPPTHCKGALKCPSTTPYTIPHNHNAPLQPTLPVHYTLHVRRTSSTLLAHYSAALPCESGVKSRRRRSRERSRVTVVDPTLSRRAISLFLIPSNQRPGNGCPSLPPYLFSSSMFGSAFFRSQNVKSRANIAAPLPSPSGN